MQTFVPFDTFKYSAQTLDNLRLNKQLLEGRQIYSILSQNKTSGGWVNHPAVKMWRNHDTALFYYLEQIKKECAKRGIAVEKNWSAIIRMHDNNWFRGDNVVMPSWWGDNKVHLSHRQNLFAKNQEYYIEFTEDSKLPKSHCCEACNYYWPTHRIEEYQ